MKDIKYTNDGKKVVVVGQLNNTEYIVQEIFVTEDGSEIPSGEKFTTKSLHEGPVETWQSKTIKSLEKQIEDLRKHVEQVKLKVSKENDKLRVISDIVKDALKTQEFIQSAGINTTLFARVLTGDIQHLVIDRYGMFEIKTIAEFLEDRDSWGYDGIKLLSVFGKRDGDIEYKVNNYKDGSGSWTTVYPCLSMEDALQTIKTFAQEKIENGGLYEDKYNRCIELGVSFDPEYAEKAKALFAEITEKSIEYKKQQAEKINIEIAELEKKLLSN